MAPRLIRVAVRELVSYALRSGDLVRGAFVSSQRLVQGTRIHQQIQRSRPAGYQAEVPVSCVLERDGFALEIGGRVDGMITARDRLLVEEIKTTQEELDPDKIQDPVHWAQAKVYAFIVARQARCGHVDVRLTYVRQDPLATLELDQCCAVADLQVLVDDLVGRYLYWARAYRAWCERRDASIAGLPFPFAAPRPGQRELMGAVEETLVDGGRLFAQAPTGIGKTISVLYPAICGLGNGQVEKIFYLTPKTVVRTVAEKATQDLRAVGLRLRSVTLTARGRICFQGQTRAYCDPAACPFALGYYDRIDQALAEAFTQDSFTRGILEGLARRHQVCPYELSLELSSWVDLVICDYNYVFDPRAYLRRFFLDGEAGWFLLIDEAHNLVDRAREMFSADLRRSAVVALMNGRRGPAFSALAESLNGIHEELTALAGEVGAENAVCSVAQDLPTDLLPLLEDFLPRAERVLSRSPGGVEWEALLDFYFQVMAFLRVAELFGDDYARYTDRGGGDVRVRLFCLDPARNLRQALRRGRAAVFFSATLAPMAYFRDLLGGETQDVLLTLDAPFPAENLHVLVADHVATTYRERGMTYGDVAASIQAVSAARSGNYMAFFPSYKYLRTVLGHLEHAAGDARLLAQTPGMTEAQRTAFLEMFAANGGDTVIGLVVMGGVFGEGIDLIGERLVGAIIVGVGLPQLCVERDLIRGYFDARDVLGFDYAYTFPGLNRVLQAAGRVIRSETDRGVVLLVDQRFGQQRYRQLLPAWWRPVHSVHGAAEIGTSLDLFWNGISGPRYEPLDE